MKQFRHKLLRTKLSRLSLCALFLVAVAALWAFCAPTSQDALVDTEQQPLLGLVIAVDAGHGGYDGGARARDSGVWEKELNLQVALKVEQELSALGATVVMTRRYDESLEGDDKNMRKRADLRARRDAAEKAGACALISIHMNEYRSRLQSGPQVFYQRGGDEGRLLAGALQQALIDTLSPQKVRAAMAGDYFVLRGALPSALVECGFLSNAAEEKLLLSDAYQQKIALAVARGVCEWRALQLAKKLPLALSPAGRQGASRTSVYAQPLAALGFARLSASWQAGDERMASFTFRAGECTFVRAQRPCKRGG